MLSKNVNFLLYVSQHSLTHRFLIYNFKKSISIYNTDSYNKVTTAYRRCPMFDFLCYNKLDSYAPSQPKDVPISFIRILNGSEIFKRFDVYAGDRIVTRGISFKKFTPYFILPSGKYKIDICQSGKKASNLQVSSMLNFMPDMIYTVAIAGTSLVEMVNINDPILKPEPPYANIRLVNLSSSIFNMTDSKNNTLFHEIGYKEASDYISISEGKHILKGIDSKIDKVSFVMNQIEIKPQWNYTIYVLESSIKQIIHPLLLIDGTTYIKKV
ncbi:MAG TPA: hypothetical protein DD429_12415 [Clostridiaceae bacterium]|nr:hypothetical protein [Clostridiaceae bacterium]